MADSHAEHYLEQYSPHLNQTQFRNLLMGTEAAKRDWARKTGRHPEEFFSHGPFPTDDPHADAVMPKEASHYVDFFPIEKGSGARMGTYGLHHTDEYMKDLLED